MTTQFRMLSDPALRRFRQFCDEASRTSRDPKDHQGAHDVASPELRRRAAAHEKLTRDQNYRRPKWARDEQARYGSQQNGAGREPGIAVDDEAPDPETVQLILKALQEGQPGEEGMMEVVKALHQRWPGCAGEWPGLDDEAEQSAMDDEDGSYWPGQRREERANEPVDEFADRGANDLPPPFKGRPTPGGHLVGDAALRNYAARWGENAMRIECATPYERPRTTTTIAMDRAMSNAASGYEARFPGVAARIKLDPIQYKRG